MAIKTILAMLLVPNMFWAQAHNRPYKDETPFPLLKTDLQENLNLYKESGCQPMKLYSDVWQNVYSSWRLDPHAVATYDGRDSLRISVNIGWCLIETSLQIITPEYEVKRSFCDYSYGINLKASPGIYTVTCFNTRVGYYVWRLQLKTRVTIADSQQYVMALPETIAEDPADATLLIFPTYVDETIQVRNPDANSDIILFDVMGKVLLRQAAIVSGQIDVSFLPAGIYIVQGVAGGKTCRRKILKH